MVECGLVEAWVKQVHFVGLRSAEKEKDNYHVGVAEFSPSSIMASRALFE